MAKPMVRTVDLEPIDRLEEKVRQLVGMVERLRSEQSRLTQENDRLAGELEMAQARLAEAEDSGAELTTLREERSLWIPYWHTSYLIARRLVAENRLAYPKLRRGEDPVFLASVLVHSTRIALVPETVYLYRRYPKTSGAAGTTFADVADTLASAANVKALFAEKYPECWHQGYAPFLLEDFRKFIARCRLDAAQLEFVASRVEALWGPAADALPAIAGPGAR